MNGKQSKRINAIAKARGVDGRDCFFRRDKESVIMRENAKKYVMQQAKAVGVAKFLREVSMSRGQ